MVNLSFHVLLLEERFLFEHNSVKQLVVSVQDVFDVSTALKMLVSSVRFRPLA